MAIRTELKEPVVETMSVSRARREFSETLNRVYRGEARVIVEKSGIEVGAIVSMAVLRSAEEKERNRRALLQALTNAREGFVGVSEEDADREIANALEDIERERRLARRIVSTINRVQPDLFNSTDDVLETTIASILKEENAKSTPASHRGADKSS